MKSITAFLFDIDGTILDTREFIVQATEHALARVGYSVPDRSIIKSHVGKPFPEFYFSLTGSHAHVAALMDAHRVWQKSHFHVATIFPNALETLETLKKKGYKLAAVTTRGKMTSIKTLKDAGAASVFDTIISGEDAPEVKPHPAPLLKALTDLGEAPASAAMVGDSHLDIEAGKNAGTKTVRATYGFHQDNLHEPEPDYVIDDISDLLRLID